MDLGMSVPSKPTHLVVVFDCDFDCCFDKALGVPHESGLSGNIGWPPNLKINLNLKKESRLDYLTIQF